jgi:hypothetical protein
LAIILRLGHGLYLNHVWNFLEFSKEPFKEFKHYCLKDLVLCARFLSQISGGVTAASGFKAAGLYGGLRAVGQKSDVALVVADEAAVVAGICLTFF